MTSQNAMSEADLIAFSRERIERGSKSFATAARLFAPDVRASAYMLYAWCRHCDDEIDGQDLGHNTGHAAGAATAATLARLRDKTLEAVAGGASEPIFLALQTVLAKHAIPARFPLDLLEGMAMDVRRQDYRTLDGTLTYAYHVAGCVGVMMAMMMGARDKPTLDRACDLGLAFQLTNIARDVAADANVGRVYLPGTWLTEAGVPAGEVANPDYRAGVHAVTLRLLDEADRYYASAYYGIGKLPWRSALAIAAARRVYSDIGNVVREGGPKGAATRAKVSSARKKLNVAKAAFDTLTAKSVALATQGPARTGLWTMKQA